MPIFVESRGILFNFNETARHEYLVYVPEGQETNYAAWRDLEAFGATVDSSNIRLAEHEDT